MTDRKPVRVSEAATQERLASLEQELAQAQEALKTQGAELSLLKAIVDNSTAVVYVKNAAGRYLMVNRQFEKVFGVAPGSMPGKTDFDVFAADDANRFRKVDEQVIATGRRIQAEEFVSLADRVHTFTSVKSPLLDADGVPYAVCGIATDISDRKQAEDVVHSQLGSMELLRRLTRAIAERQDLGSIFGTVLSTLEDRLPLDFAAIAQFDTVSQTLDLTRLGTRTQQSGAGELSEGIVLSTDSRCIARANRGELSYEPDIGSLSGRLMHQLKNAGISAVVAAPLLAESSVFGVLLVGRTRSHSFVESECDFLLQLGEHLALAIHQAQLYAVLQQAYDDLRKSQQAMLQQERLRALGQMASGVAHDINNAISPVALYTESLLDHASLDDNVREALLIIQRAIGDVAKTVARMREFSRPREAQLQLSRINLNDLVLQVIDLTRVRWRDQPQATGHVITLYADLAAELPAILGADSEIRDALINLVFNAIDAMPSGGALTIRTSCMLESPGGKYREREAVWLEVTDDGVGMEEEVRRHCLEPFYSTKGERGTGLGLAMVYGMVQRHNADLEIDSAPGKGTKVRVRFATLGMRIKSSASPSELVLARPMRILIVDDDPVIIHAMESALRSDGHTVVPAIGGREAIAAFLKAHAQQTPFDAVITDLGMPHVDGRQVAAAIKAADPSVQVIMLTGWGQRLLEDRDTPAHVDTVLSKPPRLADIRRALASARVAEASN